MSGEAPLAVTFEDVRAAAQRLRGVAKRTPVVTSRTLDERSGARVFLKAENLQRIGAFKFRGAYNAIAQLDAAQRSAGVVAYSSGNHAQGVALAAWLLEVPATIVPPYDHPWVMAGQGTVALELIEDAGPLDVLLVPLGGGGLLAGCALAAAALSPGVRIYGVEPEAGDDWVRSWRAGRIVEIPLPHTIADGQQSRAPGELAWPIVRRLGAGVVTVSDDEIRAAMQFAFERLKLVLEPSGASALAALLTEKVALRGARVGVVLSGGNVDAATFADCIAAVSAVR